MDWYLSLVGFLVRKKISSQFICDDQMKIMCIHQMVTWFKLSSKAAFTNLYLKEFSTSFPYGRLVVLYECVVIFHHLLPHYVFSKLISAGEYVLRIDADSICDSQKSARVLCVCKCSFFAFNGFVLSINEYEETIEWKAMSVKIRQNLAELNGWLGNHVHNTQHL